MPITASGIHISIIPPIILELKPAMKYKAQKIRITTMLVDKSGCFAIRNHGTNKSAMAFGEKPTVHVKEEFFLEHFNAYARMPLTDDYDCLFTEIDGVVWHCLVGRCKPCSPTEQN